MKNLVLNFQLLATYTKIFLKYTYKIISKFGENLKYLQGLVFELQPYKKNRFGRKLVLRKNSRFSKTIGKCLLFTFIMHQGYSLFHRKLPPKFEIEALFLLVILYT
ncbi:hypothetical protein FWK35_00003273, partial [Aphis craccivora]